MRQDFPQAYALPLIITRLDMLGLGRSKIRKWIVGSGNIVSLWLTKQRFGHETGWVETNDYPILLDLTKVPLIEWRNYAYPTSDAGADR